jgi:hypothetical protein
LGIFLKALRDIAEVEPSSIALCPEIP